MELRPKYSLQSLQKGNKVASREFTDREEPTTAFKHAFTNKNTESYKVLTYYGVGGIGKSRLLRELSQKVNTLNPSTVKALLDFKEEKHRSPSEAHFWLREELKRRYHVSFLTFELAYSIYWKKLNPVLDMKTNENLIPFLEEGSFIGDIVHSLQDVPIAQWIPRTLKLINSMSKYKNMIQWWGKRGKEVLTQLQDLLPNEIEERLSVYFAADLRDYVETHKCPVVIFIDTYEALWANNRQKGSFHEKDSWVQELVLQLPEVLWVIGGREKIQWGKVNPAWENEEYLEQHLMGELSEADCHQFLLSCGIVDQSIRDTIAKTSHGLPYYLDLMVDTFNLVQDKRKPEVHDFSVTSQRIIDRFLRYLELPERETLKILPFTRYWTIDLFKQLISEFKTGYPLTAYTDLFRFSFIEQQKKGEWDMNVMMKSSLQEKVRLNNDPLFSHVHAFLFSYYNDMLTILKAETITEQDKRAFHEAVYHGKHSLTPSEFTEWFIETGRVFKGGGQFQVISSLFDDVMTHLPEEQIPASFYQFYGEINLLQGAYEQSIQLFNQALSIYRGLKQHSLKEIINVCRCSMDIAEALIHTSHYKKAFSLLLEALDFADNYKGDRDVPFHSTIALLSIRLGKLNIRFSNYEESKQNYERAILECEKAEKIKDCHSNVFAHKALAYEKLGELYGSNEYSKQGECYRKAISYYEKALENENPQEYMRTLTNQGLAYKRLAEHYSITSNPSDKIRCFKQAISIYEQVLKQSPFFVDCLEKKGHALVDYMIVLIQLDLLDEAIESFQEAKRTFEKVIEFSPKQGGSRNRLASAYREYSRILIKNNQYDESLQLLKESLRLSDEVLTHTPNYLYVFNSIGKTYEQIGDPYGKQNDRHQAQFHYQKAIENYDRMLEKAPILKEPIERKANVIRKLSLKQ